MGSEQPAVLENTSAVSEDDWERWMDYIREEFLVKDHSLDEVLKSLQQINPHVTLAKLRTKLRHWGFQKSLSAKNWQYVDHAIRKRESTGKDSVVVLSGIRLREEKVKSLTSRHKAVTLHNKWKPPPSPEPPGEEVPLYICTPRAHSPITTSNYEWPSTLPWLQFSKDVLPDLISSLRLLPGSEERALITEAGGQDKRPNKRRRPNVSMALAALEKLVRRSMEIVIGSEELTGTLLASKSIDCIAKHFDQVMPATYHNENLRRAIVLSSGTRHEVQREILKMLIFLASNHLIMSTNISDSGPYMSDAQAFVDFFRLSGLAEPNLLNKIVQISLGSLTLTSVLNLLYEAAVNVEAVDLVVKLLTVDGRINPERPVGLIDTNPFWPFYVGDRVPALGLALLRGSPRFTRHMLEAGANINSCGTATKTPLVLAVLADPNDVSVQLVQTLLENGLMVHEREISFALILATMKGNVQLIDLLHKAGADISSTHPVVPSLGPGYHPSPGNFKPSRIFELNCLDNISCLAAAASFAMYPSLPSQAQENQDTALSLVKYVLNLGGPDFDVDGKLKSDAVIFASIRGYTDIVSFLYDNGARLDSRNGYLSPIYAAADWLQVDSCKLLLDLGASARPDHRRTIWSPRDQFIEFSLLHVAVYYNSTILADVLIRGGLDINNSCAIHLHLTHADSCRYDTCSCDIYQHRQHRMHPGLLGFGINWQATHFKNEGNCKSMTPLDLAIFFRFWETATLFIDSGAFFTSDNLFQVASAGSHELVRCMLERGADPNKAIGGGRTALQASIYNGNELVAIELIKFGATIGSQTLCLALHYGRCQVATKLIEMGARLSGPELSYAFRIPDKVRLRSLFESQLSDIFINERGLYGRTFLENAVLSNNVDVVRFAFSLDLHAYDSGTLCAAVLAAAGSPLSDTGGILQEVIRRRNILDQNSPQIDHILESTAVSIAAVYGRTEIVAQIHARCRKHINVAVLPKDTVWRPPGARQEYPSILATQHGSISLTALQKWNGWHSPDRWLTSPLFLPIKKKSEPILEFLLDLGYKADKHALDAAILGNIPPYLVKRLGEACIGINSMEELLSGPYKSHVDILQAMRMMNPPPPIYRAVSCGLSNLVEILLDAGANPNTGGWFVRREIIRLLVQKRRHDLIDILLLNGMNVKSEPSIRRRAWEGTSLQEASREGHLGIIRSLLKNGANPNAHGAICYGFSAIEKAAQSGRLDVVCLLLESGVITDGRGRLQYIRAIRRAKFAGHSAVVQLLECHREWVEDDQKLLKDIEHNERANFDGSIYFGAYTEDEILQLLPLVHNMGHEGYEVVRFGTPVTGVGLHRRRIKLGNSSIAQERSDTNPEASTTNSEVYLAYNSYLLSQKQESSISGDGLLGIGLLGNTGGLEDTSETQVCFEMPEDSPRDTPTGQGETWEEDERERKRQILEDILGEKEAPFQTTEWAW
ncbi:ankyrin [Hypomontagnella monticulosa]|nr:ankyrin [Hypomontagnella monticulosa]